MLPQTYLPSRNQYAPNRHSNCISRALMSSSGSCYWRKIVHSKLFPDLFFEGGTPAEFHFDHTTAHLDWSACWWQVAQLRSLLVENLPLRRCRVSCISTDRDLLWLVRVRYMPTSLDRDNLSSLRPNSLPIRLAMMLISFLMPCCIKVYEFDLKVNRYLSCSILIYG